MFGVFLAAALTTASASPVVEVSDGAVIGHVIVKASPEAALTLLADPSGVFAVSQGEGYVRATPDGACLLTDEYHPNAVMDVHYSLRVCRSEDSVVAELVSSEDIKTYSSLWRVSATEAGTRLDYRLDVRPDMPLPQWVINRTTQGSVEDLLIKLEAHLAK